MSSSKHHSCLSLPVAQRPLVKVGIICRLFICSLVVLHDWLLAPLRDHVYTHALEGYYLVLPLLILHMALPSMLSLVLGHDVSVFERVTPLLMLLAGERVEAFVLPTQAGWCHAFPHLITFVGVQLPIDSDHPLCLVLFVSRDGVLHIRDLNRAKVIGLPNNCRGATATFCNLFDLFHAHVFCHGSAWSDTILNLDIAQVVFWLIVQKKIAGTGIICWPCFHGLVVDLVSTAS